MRELWLSHCSFMSFFPWGLEESVQPVLITQWLTTFVHLVHFWSVLETPQKYLQYLCYSQLNSG